jgi:MscS family membrane protein
MISLVMKAAFYQQIIWGNSIRSYILFGLILFLGFVLKRVVSKLLSKILYKTFKKLYPDTLPDKFHELLSTPIESLITVLFVFAAINQLDFPLNEIIFRRITYVDRIQKVFAITLIEVLDKLFSFLIIIASVRIALRVIDFVAHIFAYRASLTESKLDDQMVPFLKELSKILIIITCVFIIMGVVFNMNVATIVAGLGIGGLAIALAAQDTLQNLLGSFTIFADKPFVVGNLVRILGYDAVVEKVGFRSTVLRTLDKTLVIIPNKKMIDSPLENLSLRNLRRVEFSIGLTYNTSASLLKLISSQIRDFINEHKLTSNDTVVNFNAFNSSSLDIKILYFIEIVEYETYTQIKDEINYKILQIVLDNNASFAFPTSTVYHEPSDSTRAVAVNDKK